MSWSVYSKDSFKVNVNLVSSEFMLEFIGYYVDLFKYSNVKSGEIIECLIGNGEGDLEDILMDKMVIEGIQNENYISIIKSLDNFEILEFECMYSLEVNGQFEESINFFSELLENNNEEGIEFRNLTYTDEDDDVLLYLYTGKLNGTPEVEKGILKVADIKLWNDNNYFLSLEINESDYIKSKSELEIIMNQIADLNRNTFETTVEDGVVMMIVRGSAEFNLNNFNEYIALLEKLVDYSKKEDASLTLVNNLFSYEFALLNVIFEDESIKVYSSRI